MCASHGCTLLVLNNEQLSPEREMVEDLMTIIDCFWARLSGLGNYKKTLTTALKTGHGAKNKASGFGARPYRWHSGLRYLLDEHRLILRGRNAHGTGRGQNARGGKLEIHHAVSGVRDATVRNAHARRG